MKYNIPTHKINQGGIIFGEAFVVEKELVEESVKTRKVRKKLEEHLAKIDQQVTKQELNRKINEIHCWISRHAPQRVNLKEKAFSLFDGNQNTAQISQKISQLAIQLKDAIDKQAADLENHRASKE